MVQWDWVKGSSLNGVAKKDYGIMGRRVVIDMDLEDSINHSPRSQINRIEIYNSSTI